MKCSYMDLGHRNLFFVACEEKGADQTEHPCSLISTMVFHSLESKISKLATRQNFIIQAIPCS